jgi:hypothetical protein
MYAYGIYAYGMYAYGMYAYGMYAYGMYTYGMNFGIQKKTNFTISHHLEMEIGIILRHKLGKTYPSFQTNWFDNI